MKRLALALVLLCGCQAQPTANGAINAESFIAEDRVAKQVLANGLIELTERVMVLEKRERRRLRREKT